MICLIKDPIVHQLLITFKLCLQPWNLIDGCVSAPPKTQKKHDKMSVCGLSSSFSTQRAWVRVLLPPDAGSGWQQMTGTGPLAPLLGTWLEPSAAGSSLGQPWLWWATEGKPTMEDFSASILWVFKQNFWKKIKIMWQKWESSIDYILRGINLLHLIGLSEKQNLHHLGYYFGAPRTCLKIEKES